MKKNLIASLALSLFTLLSVGTLRASVVVTPTDWSGDALSANFTTEGTKDWIIWDSNPDNFALFVQNRKEGGTAISNLTAIGSQGEQDFGGYDAAVWGDDILSFSPGLSFSYTDGASPESTTDNSPGAAFKRWYYDAFGAVAQFTVPVLASEQTLKLYLATVNKDDVAVRYSLNEGVDWSAWVDNSVSISGGESTGIFEFVYSDPTATEMRVQVSQSSAGNSANDYLIVGGATLIPEPSMFALLGIGVGLIVHLRFRRRRPTM